VNSLQALAFFSVACFSLAIWPLIACAIPISIPPSLPPSLCLLFLFVHIPIITTSLLLGPAPDGIMKATPRKKKALKDQDKERFLGYLLTRCASVAVALFATGWCAVGSVFKHTDEAWYHRYELFLLVIMCM
jgi:hypothetical protein